MDDDESDEDDEPALGPDGDLVPEIVSKAVIPLLIRQFSSSPTGNSGGYDPYSSSETRRAVDLLEHIEELLGSEKRSFQSLVAAVLSPFTPLSGALTELSSTPGVVVPLPPSSHSTPDRSLKRFLARLMKLLRNLLAFLPFSPMRVPELANELVEVGRLVAEKEGNWEMGGKVWAGRVLGVFERAGKECWRKARR
jgi:GC-rich sequence DNA-binding factor